MRLVLLLRRRSARCEPHARHSPGLVPAGEFNVWRASGQVLHYEREGAQSVSHIGRSRTRRARRGARESMQLESRRTLGDVLSDGLKNQVEA
jgi:hypothetical protein